MVNEEELEELGRQQQPRILSKARAIQLIDLRLLLLVVVLLLCPLALSLLFLARRFGLSCDDSVAAAAAVDDTSTSGLLNFDLGVAMLACLGLDLLELGRLLVLAMRENSCFSLFRRVGPAKCVGLAGS